MTIHTSDSRRGRTALLAAGVAVAALAGAACGPAPAHAAATASVCDYNPDNKNVIVNDFSGSAELRLLRRGEDLMVADGLADPRFCFKPGVAVATVTNTEKITVFAARQQVGGGYQIDQNNGRFAPGATVEADGDSEIEIALVTSNTIPPLLRVAGTPQRDIISVGAGGKVNFSYDADADVEPQTTPNEVLVTGGVGNDELDNLGGGIFAPKANTTVRLEGNAGNDMIHLSSSFLISSAFGGSDDDRLFTANTTKEALVGGSGNDTALIDTKDVMPFGDIEKASFPDVVGRWRITPSVIDARVSEPAKLKVSWTHPKAWKRLRTIKLGLNQGADSVGTITIRPRDGRMRASGAVKLARGSKMSHHGKTVTARVAMRVSRALAGQAMRVSVEATDRKGRTQVELHAGVIRVAG